MCPDTPRPPVDKHDQKSLESFWSTPVKTWQHLIPDLLTWLQDRNWPIYPDIRVLMVRHASATFEPLKAVLEEQDDDAEWQANCVALISEMPVEVKSGLRPSLLALRDRVRECDDIDYDMKAEIDAALQ